MIWCYHCDEEILDDSWQPIVDEKRFLKENLRYRAPPSVAAIRELLAKKQPSPKIQPKKVQKTSQKLPLAERGMAGLSNLGNTCYLNSAVQCLSHVFAMSQYFQKCLPSHLYFKFEKKTQLSRSYREMIGELWSHEE